MEKQAECGGGREKERKTFPTYRINLTNQEAGKGFLFAGYEHAFRGSSLSKVSAVGKAAFTRQLDIVPLACKLHLARKEDWAMFFFFFFLLKYEHKSLRYNIVTLVNRFRGSCIEILDRFEIYFLRDSKKRHVVGSFLVQYCFYRCVF